MNPVEKLKEYLDAGKATLSPKQAAEVLNCHPYSLNVAAQQGRLTIPHLFAGRNLRISTAGLYTFVTGTEINYSRPQWLARESDAG